jgi:hypothetical protein
MANLIQYKDDNGEYVVMDKDTLAAEKFTTQQPGVDLDENWRPPAPKSPAPPPSVTMDAEGNVIAENDKPEQ